MTLEGKTLFISGGSRGIGLAIALRAAADGANVALIAKTAEPHPKLEGTVYTAAEQIEEAGGKALPIVGDIRDEASVAAAVEQAVERFGGIDVVVNNASAIDLRGTEALDLKRYDLMQDINTRGTFVVTKACVAHLKQAAEPAHPHALAADRPQAAVARAAHRLHDRQVRHVAVRAGLGRGVPRGRHRLQRALAAHADRHRRRPEPARRRRRDGPRPPPRGLRRRRLRDPDPPQPRVHGQHLPVRGRARRRRASPTSPRTPTWRAQTCRSTCSSTTCSYVAVGKCMWAWSSASGQRVVTTLARV